MYKRQGRRNGGQEKVEEGEEIEKGNERKRRGQCSSALPDSLAGFQGAFSKGGEWERRAGKKVEEGKEIEKASLE